MAQNLSAGNDAVALLGNTIPTGAILFVLIAMLGPVSGAHFNPAVSLVFAGRGELAWRDAAAYSAVQIGFGVLGVFAAHVMFDLPVLQVSEKARAGTGQLVSEAIATAGLILTIIGTLRHRAAAVPASVALYIVAAYWFTASTSFANPAITVARSLTDTFSGISPDDAVGFIAAQLFGAALGAVIGNALFPDQRQASR